MGIEKDRFESPVNRTQLNQVVRILIGNRSGIHLGKGDCRMRKKGLSLILIGVGIILLLVSLLADVVGIGGYPGIGFKQIIGAVVGAVIAIIGFRMLRK